MPLRAIQSRRPSTSRRTPSFGADCRRLPTRRSSSAPSCWLRATRSWRLTRRCTARTLRRRRRARMKQRRKPRPTRRTRDQAHRAGHLSRPYQKWVPLQSLPRRMLPRRLRRASIRSSPRTRRCARRWMRCERRLLRSETSRCPLSVTSVHLVTTIQNLHVSERLFSFTKRLQKS